MNAERDVALFLRKDRFQFTTSDLLLILGASLAGMAFLVPVLFRDNRVVGCVTVEIGTIAGALIAIRFTNLHYPDRNSWLVCGIVSGWLCAVVIYLIGPSWREVLAFIVAALVLFAPSILVGIVSYMGIPHVERERRPVAGVWKPLIIGVVGNILLIVVVLPKLLKSPMSRGEIAPAASCKAYAEAQEIYHRTDYSGDGVLKFAQHLKGDQSLLETVAGTGSLGLVDRSFGDAEIADGHEVPKAGYVFKILKGRVPLQSAGRNPTWTRRET